MEIEGGAWCPKGPISKDSYEYLQIDFGQLKVITLVETQGRFGRGQVSLKITCVYSLHVITVFLTYLTLLYVFETEMLLI